MEWEERAVPRTLTIHTPNRPKEYWFTELVFEIGDEIERGGETWVVTSIGPKDSVTGKHISVTVRPDEQPLAP